jgi:uncharacterized damage-inducible protein DinB
MISRPSTNEAAPYYFGYIDRVPDGDILAFLQSQLDETLAFLPSVSEEKSRYRYEPEKWSIRQVLNHINDCERLFLLRAFWFARGFDSELPSFDQETSANGAEADRCSWSSHVDDFRASRQASLTFLRNLPAEAWKRKGTASGNPFSVRALAYIAGGHVVHHVGVIRERYLGAASS